MEGESTEWMIGVLLNVVATLAGTVGKQFLRFAAVRQNAWYYPLGLFFTGVIDPIFDAGAYSFAAASIITACAGMVTVWNVLLAPYALGEPLTRPRMWGSAMIAVGTIFTGVFGNHTEVNRSVEEYLELFSRPAALVYYGCMVAAVAFCWVKGRDPNLSPQMSGYYMSTVAGILAGNTFTTKAVVEMVECVSESSAHCESNPFLTVWPYVFICGTLVFSGGSLLILAIALRGSEALASITIFEGFMIISGAISGNIVLNEKAGQPAEILWAYFASICIILFGLGVLCRGEHRNRQHAHDSMLDAVEMDDAGKEQFSALSSTTPSGPDGRRDSGGEPPGSAASSASGESNGHAQHIA